MVTGKTDRNLKLFFLFHLFDAVSFLAPVMTLFMIHRGMSYSNILTLFLVWVTFTLLGEVPTGAIGDRFGLKTAFLLGAAMKFTAFVIYLFARDIYMFSVSMACFSLADTFYSGSDQAFVFETLKESGRENEMSETMGRILSARFIPPIVTVLMGAWLAKDLREEQFVLLIVLGLIFNLVAIIFLVMMRVPRSYAVNRESSGLQHVKQGLKNMFAEKNLVLMFLNECLVMIPTYVFIAEESLAQPYLVQAGLPVYMLGVVYSVLMVFTSFSLNCIKFLERFFTQKALAFVTGLTILSGFLMASFGPVSLGAVIFVFYSIYIALLLRYSLFSELKNMYIPSKSRATTLSLISMVRAVFEMAMIASFIFFSSLGFKPLFIVCALFVIAGLLFPVRLKENPGLMIKQEPKPVESVS